MIYISSVQSSPLQEIAIDVGIDIRDEKNITLEMLSQSINQLIINDFSRLVAILYRMDVSEKKLKSLLKDNEQQDAGMIIARLMVERQEEKRKSRESFKPRDNNNINEDEKW